MKKTRTITVEWEDGDLNDHCFEMDVPENADEDTVNQLVEYRVWDEAVFGMKGAAMIYKRKARKSHKVGPEHRIQNDIIKILRLNHCNVMRANAGIIKTQNGSVFKGMENGTPDLIGFRWQDKQIFFIEVKSPTGRIRSDQLAYHSDLMHHKVIHGIARSVDDALKIVNEGLIGYGYPDTDKKEWY